MSWNGLDLLIRGTVTLVEHLCVSDEQPAYLKHKLFNDVATEVRLTTSSMRSESYHAITKPVWTVLVRKSASWKDVDERLDAISTHANNQFWKRKVTKIVASMLFHGEKLNQYRGNTDNILQEVCNDATKLSGLCQNAPADCQTVATFIKVHIHSLLLFSHLYSSHHCRKVSPNVSDLFIEIVSGPMNVQQNLEDSIVSRFEIRETKTKYWHFDPSQPDRIAAQAHEIELTAQRDKPLPPNCSKEEEIDHDTQASLIFNIVTTAIAQANRDASHPSPIPGQKYHP